MTTERDRDHYAVLQVSRAAGQADIERAYKRLSAVYDPATSKKPRAAARLKEVEEAYEVLSDRKRRTEYDRQLGARRGGGPVPGAATGILANQYLWMVAAGLIVTIAVVVVLLIVVGGSGSSNTVVNATVNATVKAASPTPVGQTPGPTAPANPPAVSGEPATTADGLQYIDSQPGTGATPKAGETLVVNYTGWLQSDGTKFDSSLDRNAPYSFVLGAGNVIKGWDEGLSTMQVGGKRRLIIPPALGYGSTARGPIPASSTLIFDVELLAIGSGTSTPPPATVAPAPSP